jgi:hypothetical protein
MPSSASRTTASGSLMSFFMLPPLGRRLYREGTV